MKKFLLFLLLIITGSFYQAKSQIMLDPNNRWTYLESEYAWGYRSVSFFINGDTTLNQISYKKILVTSDSISTSGQFWSALREDTIAKKVYSFSWRYPQEVLLYDFGLAAGDSFLFPMFYDSNTYVKLDSITLIMLLDGSIRRKFNFSYEWLNWIEGIGSEISLDYPLTIDPDRGFQLFCFQKSNARLYFESNWFNGNSCYVPFTGINTINKIDVEISPNPASNSFKIKGEQLQSYQLTDLNGKIIQENKITNDDELIPILSVSSGLYFLKVIGKEGIAVKKLIIN